MVDRMLKVLKKLSRQERAEADRIIELILMNRLEDLDVKKLKGTSNVYRVRKGSVRIIFRKVDPVNRLVAIERRSEKTYRDF